MADVINEIFAARLFDAVAIAHQCVRRPDLVGVFIFERDPVLPENHIIQFLAYFAEIIDLFGVVFCFDAGMDCDLIAVFFFQPADRGDIARVLLHVHMEGWCRLFKRNMVRKAKDFDACLNCGLNVLFIFPNRVAAALGVGVPVFPDHNEMGYTTET